MKIDTQGINDEVVTGVIEQLEKTGNKPQLVKELAAVLCNSLNIVERYASPHSSASPARRSSARARADTGGVRCSSANPQAIISSRLNAYLRRPWTALAPCPIAKTLIPTHPRRIYFYLTNTPHQPLPQSSSESPLPSNRRSAVISPSLSSDEDAESRKRAALSPSPEVDLSVPDELDDDGGPPTPAGSFSGRSSLARDGSHPSSGGGVVEAMGHSHRAISPPLEGDEREFTQTASVMQSKRSMSREQQNQASPDHEGDTVRMSTEDETGEGGRGPSVVTAEESEESAFARNSEAAAALFGHAQTMAAAAASGLSSPLVRPATAGLQVSTSGGPRRLAAAHGGLMEVDGGKMAGGDEGSLNLGLGWASDMISPEKVDLEELDDLFGDGF